MKIDFKELVYINNPRTGYFEKQPQRIAFNKMPFELKVEPTQQKNIIANGATELIRSRQLNKKYLFFTGMIKTPCANWYFGNDYEYLKGLKKLSLVIFFFAADNTTLKVFYFNHFHKDSAQQRAKFVNDFIVEHQNLITQK